MALPRTFVLYVGDPPSLLSLAALDRQSRRATPKTITLMVGRRSLVDVRALNGLVEGEGPTTEYAITPLATGITGIVAQSLGPDGPLGQIEAFIEVRPANGHTVALAIGAPDANLAPPPPPAAEAELTVAPSRPLSEKNPSGDGAGAPAATPETKATALRAKLLERYGLPADASDDDIHKAINDGVSAAFVQGRAEGGDAGKPANDAKKNTAAAG